MDQRVERSGSASARQFSTRFLPSDGIPAYNALLDTNLGKRREFLLGNRQSLELMQQTGVIERVESQPDNPNQYVVHIAEKPIHRRKRLPPRSCSNPLQLPESQLTPWRQHSTAHSVLGAFSKALGRNGASTPQLQKAENPATNADKSCTKANVARLKGLGRSYSTGMALSHCKPVLKSSAANRLALFGSTKCSALLEAAGGDELGLNAHGEPNGRPSRLSVMRQRSCSAPTVDQFMAGQSNQSSHAMVVKKSVAAMTASNETPQPVVKGTVEHLLESDASFMAQIRVMKDQLSQLESTKTHLDAEIGLLRRKLRGVNAVRENDVAVAHCSSIMQHRLSKAEEEYMKLVTQQQQVKKDVDRVRRELLSLRKVRHTLETDIESVTQANQVFEEKIHASKVVRNQLSEELSELERQAETELEEQRLNLPPEDAVVVDVAKLMSAVQERTVNRRNASFTGYDVAVEMAQQLHSGVVTASPGGSPNDKTSRRKSICRNSGVQNQKLLSHSTAFVVLQNSLGLKDLSTFEQQFTATEEQLLSKYKANLALADELAALEKELHVLNTEKRTNRANVRGIMQANEKVERDMQVRVQSTLRNIRTYNDLREQRNREHARLRGIMIKCLEALQVDSRNSDLSKTDGSNTRSSGHGLLLSEMPSPELLEKLQRKMTQVAITMKVRHSSHMFDVPAEALRLNRGHDGRRSNMFSARDASKIVLGPRDPSGSALSAILSTVQAPSIESALTLTDNISMMEVMHGLHRATSPARRRASSLTAIPPVIGNVNGSLNGGIVSPGVLPDSDSDDTSVTSRSFLSSVHVLPSTLPPLGAMAEEEKEDEEDEEDEGDRRDDEQSEDDNDEDVDVKRTEDDELSS